MIDEGAFLLGQGTLAEGFQHGVLLKEIDGVAGALPENLQPGGDLVFQIVVGDEPVARNALEVFHVIRSDYSGHAKRLGDVGSLGLDPMNHALPLEHFK